MPDSATNKAIKIFISYAPEDKNYKKELTKHLESIFKEGLIVYWDNEQVMAGMDLVKERKYHLDNSQLILLLISSYAIANASVYDEIQKALQRYRQKTAIVVPILIRPLDLTLLENEKLVLLPYNKLPVSIWRNQHEAYEHIVQNLRKTILNFEKILKGEPVDNFWISIEKKKTKQSRVKWAMIIITALFGLFAILSVFFKDSNPCNQSKSSINIHPFEKSTSLKILIFPFEEYFGQSNTNLSKAIYNKVYEIKKQHDLQHLEIKYFEDSYSESMECLNYISNSMNADFFIRGSYEINPSCEKSICIINLNFNKSVGYDFSENEKVEFSSILKSVESGDFTEKIEFYIYYVLGYMELENGGNPKKGYELLIKSVDLTQNDSLKYFIENNAKALLNKSNLSNHIGIPTHLFYPKSEKKDYGRSKKNPVFTKGMLNSYFFARSLKYKGEPLSYCRISPTVLYLPRGHFAIIDRYLLQNKYGRKAFQDTIYIYPYAKENHYKAPRKLTFSPNLINPDAILNDF